MKSVRLYTAAQLIDTGIASSHASVQALVAAGDLHPEGMGHARYPAAEVERLANMPTLDISEPAVLVKLSSWVPENGTVFAGRPGRGFRDGITPQELADSARGAWRVAPARFYGAGLLIPAHLGITRGAFRIVGPGPIPVGNRWAVEVEPLQDGNAKSRRLAKQIIDRRIPVVGRSPIHFLNGA